MATSRSEISKKILNSQSREIISNVREYFEKEAKFGIQIPLTHITKRVTAATKVSERSVRRIANEKMKINCGESHSFSTPGKSKQRKCPVTGIDSFDISVIRRTIHDFQLTGNVRPTLNSILQTVTESINFSGSKTSLWRIIKKLGFRWKKSENNRAVLMERHDIRAARISYLRQLKKYREDGRPIIYMDETYIHSSCTSGKGWTDSSDEGLKAPLAKGQRLIIVHAGGEKGFIKNALLIFKSQQKTGDYHHEMNAGNYELWLKEKIIPNLPNNSVLVINNTPYHNTQDQRCPTSNSRRKEMQEWLMQHKIPFSSDLLKPELYELIKMAKPRNYSYHIDKILAEHNHSVLRLPPYHSDLNPIELIWADVKQSVEMHNVTFKLDDVKTLCEKRFSEIGKQEWAAYCNHVITIEKQYWQNEGIVDSITEEPLINLCDDSDEIATDNEDDDSSGIEELSD